ncbi:MAG: biopolymer transporter ExbD [Pseudomonadota bacterium]
MPRKQKNIKAEEEAAIDMTPMLDIVFIMLIFFIVTTSFVKESGVDVNRPNASEATKRPKANIFVAITEDDEVWVDKRKIEAKDLSPHINRLLVESPDGEVIIQADRKAKNGTLVQVMDAVKLSDAKKVSVSASTGG